MLPQEKTILANPAYTLTLATKPKPKPERKPMLDTKPEPAAAAAAGNLFSDAIAERHTLIVANVKFIGPVGRGQALPEQPRTPCQARKGMHPCLTPPTKSIRSSWSAAAQSARRAKPARLGVPVGARTANSPPPATHLAKATRKPEMGAIFLRLDARHALGADGL